MSAPILAEWEDLATQRIYEMLCDDLLEKPSEEHWEGYVSRWICGEFISPLRERIAALEAKLAEAQWKPIKPESLPKIGDEALRIYVSYSGLSYQMVQSITPLMCVDFDHCKQAGWVFYRALNAPEHPRADCEGCGDSSCPCNLSINPPCLKEAAQ